MGCPSIYYKRALQYFAYGLVSLKDKKLAEELYNEQSESNLKNFILKIKENCSLKQFYYDAGRTAQIVLDEANNEGCDAFNACIGGLNMFEDFIGLSEDKM